MNQPMTAVYPALKQTTPNAETLIEIAESSYENSLLQHHDNAACSHFRHQAQQAATGLLSLQRYRPVALHLLARIALDEGFYTKAGDLLQQALALESDNAGLWYSQGHLYLTTQQLDKALHCFDHAIALDPNATRAHSSRAYTLARKGSLVEAFTSYRQLVRRYPDDDSIKAKLFECTAQLKADYYDPQLEQDVLYFLTLEGADHNQLTPLICSLLRYKYDLTNQDSVIDIDHIAQDPFLNEALKKIYVCDPLTESFITQLRKQLLLHALKQTQIPTAHLTLITNLMLYCCHNEYVYAIDSQEQPLLHSLVQLLQSMLRHTHCQPHHLCGSLMLYALYQPPYELACAAQLATFALEHWPAYAQQAIAHVLYQPLGETHDAPNIWAFKTITDPISLAVKAQYEANPYPRWLHLNFNTPTNYGRALEFEFQGFRAPSFFNMGQLDVLIAGCGTGRHAIHVAKHFRGLRVVAIDLSRRSLAYAQKMAQQFNIHNIEFIQADILNLDSWQRRFHIIECSGVLHHMHNPRAGLAVLKGLLHPKGLIKIGLYSKLARKTIAQCRQIIRQRHISASAQGIRHFRQIILHDKVAPMLHSIVHSADFYSMSGCRDMLFHVQEHQFSITDIEQLCQDFALNFIGFVNSAGIKRRYQQQFDDDNAMNNLSNWATFEQQHPMAFGTMYQFYCQNQ